MRKFNVLTTTIITPFMIVFALGWTSVASPATQSLKGEQFAPNPEEIRDSLRTGLTPDSSQDQVFKVNYDLPTVNGEHLAIREAFTVRSLSRHDRRVVALIPGTIGTTIQYDVPVEGFNALEILARAGYYAAAIELPGIGNSSHPSDGRVTNNDYNWSRVRPVLAELALIHGVRRVDVFGETGSGTGLVLLASRDRAITRTVSGAGLLYLEPGPVASVLLTQGWKSFLDSLPTGYFPTDFHFYDPFFTASDVAVRDYLQTNLPGFYPTGLFYELFAARPGGPGAPDPDPTMPIVLAHALVDPAAGAVPALFIQGTADIVAVPGDSGSLARDYGTSGGGRARYIAIPGGTHLVRLDAISSGPDSLFWNQLIDFLDRH